MKSQHGCECPVWACLLKAAIMALAMTLFSRLAKSKGRLASPMKVFAVLKIVSANTSLASGSPLASTWRFSAFYR